MEPRTAATRVPDPDAVEFIRFCYRRRRVGWPELYDEMCAVAGRGLFRGHSADDLAAFGIGFSLFDMPALAALANRIVAEEIALRRPMTVTITPVVDETAADAAAVAPDGVAPDAVALDVIDAASEPEPASVDVLVPEPVIATTLSVAVPTAADEPAASPVPRIRFAPVPAGA